MANLKNCRYLPQAELDVWEGGCIKLPLWITGEKGRPYRPVIEIWADQRSGAIIYYNLESHMPAAQNSINSLLKAMTKPLVGPPRRPKRLRVSDETVASSLREKLEGLDVTVERVEHCKLVEIIAAEISKTMGRKDDGDPIPGLMSLPGITLARAEAFFRAATTFYEQAPWQFISDHEPLEVSCAGFSRSPLYLTVMGNGGQEFGLVLFYQAEDLKRLYQAGSHFDLMRNPLPTASVLFSDPTFLAIEDVDAIESQQWPVAGPEAYPHMFQIVPESAQLLQPPSLDQVNIFEACLLAVPQIFRKRKTNARAPKRVEKETTVETFHGSWLIKVVLSPGAW